MSCLAIHSEVTNICHSKVYLCVTMPVKQVIASISIVALAIDIMALVTISQIPFKEHKGNTINNNLPYIHHISS